MSIRFNVVKSSLSTIAGKYTGQVVYNDTVYLDDIAEKVCKTRVTIDEADFRLAVRATAARIMEEVCQNFNYVTTDTLCAFTPAISGSVPSMDSALGLENKLYVNITPLSTISDAVGAITPVKATVDAVRVVIDNEEDLSSHLRNTIVGQRRFVVTGSNLSAHAEGESLKLVALDGTEASAVTVETDDGCGERLFGRLATAVTAGTYKLELKSRGYSTPDAEVEVYQSRKLVVVVDTAAPTITNVYPFGSSGAVDKISAEQDLCIAGTNFTGVTKVAFKHYATGSTELYERVVESSEMTITDNLVTLTGDWWIMYQAGIDQTKPVTFEITTAGGTATRPATY